MAFVSGNGIILKSGSTTIQDLTEIELSIDQEVVDVSSMTLADWETLIRGKRDASINFSGLVDWQNAAGMGLLLTGLTAGTTITAVFERVAVATAGEFQRVTMSMLIENMEFSFNDNEGITCSGSMKHSAGTPTVVLGN